jgi:hypothetical protein
MTKMNLYHKGQVFDFGLPEARVQTYDLSVVAFFDIKSGQVAWVTNYYNLNRWEAQSLKAKQSADDQKLSFKNSTLTCTVFLAFI